MKTNAHYIIKHPIITEETQIQASKGPQFTFKVNPKANKQQIRAAIEEIYPEVKVTRVNTMNYLGKEHRVGTGQVGRRAKWKKAIVTLRDGDKIDLI